jgi:hypothetical protein
MDESGTDFRVGDGKNFKYDNCLTDASSPNLLNPTGQEVSTLGIVALKSELKGENNNGTVAQNHSTLDMLRK